MFLPYNTENIRLAYKSKHNFRGENKVILLMITDGKKWHYLAVKILPPLFRWITSNHDGDFYCLSCLIAFIAFVAFDAGKNKYDYYRDKEFWKSFVKT